MAMQLKRTANFCAFWLGGESVNLAVYKVRERTYLAIKKSYRNAEGKSSKKTIKSLGYLDELEKQYPDPIAHFREVARQMSENEKAQKRVHFNVDMDEELPVGAIGAKNLGYALPLKIYHQLGLDKFLKGKALSENFKFNSNSIMILLVMTRLLAPGSKKSAFEAKDRFF
jgi:hypothetical protein